MIQSKLHFHILFIALPDIPGYIFKKIFSFIPIAYRLPIKLIEVKNKSI